jgi:hypothetical protein
MHMYWKAPLAGLCVKDVVSACERKDATFR